MRITVVGAGSWGTALADLLARRGHSVRLWAREVEVVESINSVHTNSLFLPDAPLAQDLTATSNLPEAISNCEMVVSAAPSHAVRKVCEGIREGLNGLHPLLVSVSKGLETDSLKPMTEVIGETLPGLPVVALSGPTFAREVYEKRPSAIVAASVDERAARGAQEAFSTGHFRVYTSDDPLGVQLGGALKNVIAIAAGILEGLGLGDNARAALITRGLAEMIRLGKALGCDSRTLSGLAGMGDLILTATGKQSRNHSLGEELAGGKSLEEIVLARRTVAEGVGTTKAAVALGRRENVELPIAQEVENMLFNAKKPLLAVKDLMERELKPEHW